MSGFRNFIDTGSGRLLFYANVPPVTPDEVTAETLLATIALPVPCAVVGDDTGIATLTFTVPLQTLAVASGLIGWTRIADAAGGRYLDLLAGLVGSGAPVILNTAQVFTGGEVKLLSLILVE